MRGVVPIGVTAPRGETSVTLSPARSVNWSARRRPITTPCPWSKPSSVPCLMFLAIEVSPREVGAADAAHQHARGVERRRGERLAFDDRHREPDALDLRDPLGHRLVVGQRRFQRLHQQMAVEAEDLAEQFLAEAVHHRHDDDERRDAQHDAEEREAGDDRNESFLAPRPQVAQRQHPFERGKRPCPGRFAHRSPLRTDFIRFWRIQASYRRHARLEKRTAYRDKRSIVAAGLRFSRLPSARFLISKVPAARPFGPITTCQGTPIRSAVANLEPGRSSRS